MEGRVRWKVRVERDIRQKEGKIVILKAGLLTIRPTNQIFTCLKHQTRITYGGDTWREDREVYRDLEKIEC